METLNHHYKKGQIIALCRLRATVSCYFRPWFFWVRWMRRSPYAAITSAVRSVNPSSITINSKSIIGLIKDGLDCLSNQPFPIVYRDEHTKFCNPPPKSRSGDYVPTTPGRPNFRPIHRFKRMFTQKRHAPGNTARKW